MKNDFCPPGSQSRSEKLETSESVLERFQQPTFEGEASAEKVGTALGEDTSLKAEVELVHSHDELLQRDATIAELQRRISELEQHLETFATLLQADRTRFRATDRARDPEHLLSELAERLASFEKARQQQQTTIDQLSHSWAMRQVDDTLDQDQSRDDLLVRLGKSVNRAQRSGVPLFCVMIGIDQPQKLRREHGEPNYGFFFFQVAQRLRLTLRQSDKMMRCDDETFLLIPEAKTLDQLRSLAERLIKTICLEPLRMSSQQLKPSISISVVQYQSEIGGANELIQLARRILVKAQTQGQKRIVVHPESAKSPKQ